MKKKVLTGCILLLFPLVAFSANLADQLKKPVKKSINIRRTTQKQTDLWAEEKTKLKYRYKKLLTENKELSALNTDLKEEVEQREKNISTLERKISETLKVSEELLPYLNTVTANLQTFVDNDLPFLNIERDTRMKGLHEVMKNPETSTSEKYRRVMEALTVETEYGRNVEVYQQRISIDQKEILVNVLRVGRLALFFESLDNKTSGIFDQSKVQWTILPHKDNRGIHTAIEIAEKRRTIELVTLPIGRLTVP